jgi:hypothetical protein
MCLLGKTFNNHMIEEVSAKSKAIKVKLWQILHRSLSNIDLVRSIKWCRPINIGEMHGFFAWVKPKEIPKSFMVSSLYFFFPFFRSRLRVPLVAIFHLLWIKISKSLLFARTTISMVKRINNNINTKNGKEKGRGLLDQIRENKKVQWQKGTNHYWFKVPLECVLIN